MCKENCEYRGININTKNIICECNLNINRNYSERNEDNYFLFNETGNLFDYLLDNINYGLFKCFKLLFNFQNLEKNISFYSMIIISFILLIMNIKFYTFDLSKLKLLLTYNSTIINSPNNGIIKDGKVKKTKKNIVLEPKKKKRKKKRKKPRTNIYNMKIYNTFKNNTDDKSNINNINNNNIEKINKIQNIIINYKPIILNKNKKNKTYLSKYKKKKLY